MTRTEKLALLFDAWRADKITVNELVEELTYHLLSILAEGKQPMLLADIQNTMTCMVQYGADPELVQQMC